MNVSSGTTLMSEALRLTVEYSPVTAFSPAIIAQLRDPWGSNFSSKWPVRIKPLPLVTTIAQMKSAPNRMYDDHALILKKKARRRTGTQARGAWKTQRMAKPTAREGRQLRSPARAPDALIVCVSMPRFGGSVLGILRKLGQIAPVITATILPPSAGGIA